MGKRISESRGAVQKSPAMPAAGCPGFENREAWRSLSVLLKVCEKPWPAPKFVVVDDKTGRVIQVSKAGHFPNHWEQ